MVIINEKKKWHYTQRMGDLSRSQPIRFIADLERLLVGSKSRKIMAQMAAMFEPSPVVDLYTALPTVLELALPSRLQNMLDLQEITVQGQLSGAMNQISRNETKCTEQVGALDACNL